MRTWNATVVLLIAAAVAAAKPISSPGDTTIAAAAGDQSSPAIARGNDLFLAVWSDARANVTGGYEGETSRDIYGLRLDANGNPLDSVPIIITAARAAQENPKLSWNGVNWLVVYETYDLSGTGSYYQKSLQSVRVSPAGNVLDATPIKLFGLTPSGGRYWALACDGTNWVVVNQGSPTGSDMVAVRISAAGVLLDPPTRVLVPGTYYGRFDLKLAYAGGVFALTYSDEFVNGNTNTKLVRFDSNLAKLDAAPLTLLDVSLSDLAGNGTGFYIVWNRQDLDGSVHVVGSRVNTVGAKLDGDGVNLFGTKEPGYGATTAVVWDGVNWRVTWGDLTTLWIARVNAGGRVLGRGSVAVPGPQTGPTAGSGTGAIQVIWTVFTNNNNDVFTANVSPSNIAGPSRTLSVGAAQQLRPDVATSGNGYMMVYRSSTAASIRVLAQPLDAAGNPLTAEPVQLDAGPSLNGPGSPNVAWNGSLYLVSWGATNGIVAQRLSATGAKVDGAPFMVMSGCFGPADVTALGGDFLVSGRKVGFNIQYIFPVAARVSGGGAVLDASPLALGSSYLGTAPAVAALGGRWLVAWHRNVTHDDSRCFSMGAFIDAGGTAAPEFQIHGPFSTAGGNGIFEVGLGSSGDKALFVQSQELTSGVENDLLCHVIDATGTVGPQINLTPWVGNQYKPRVAWDGTNFIVVYHDQKNRLATLDQLDARSDLFGMRVSPTGAIVDPQGFVFSASPMGETDPNLTASNGVTLIAGSVLNNEPPYDNYRVVYDRLGVGGNQWPVAVAAATSDGGDVPLMVSFSSVGSNDPDGSIVSYAWDFGDGFTSALASPSHTFTLGEPAVVTLTVTDDMGAATTQALVVKPTKTNDLPVAIATAIPTAGPSPLEVTFYADGSYDPDGFIGNIHWVFSDGGEYWGSPAYHTFHDPGIHAVTMTVFDSRGGTGSADVSITAYDFATFVAHCLGGPETPYGEGCDLFDVDLDGDGDLPDVAVLQNRFTGH